MQHVKRLFTFKADFNSNSKLVIKDSSVGYAFAALAVLVTLGFRFLIQPYFGSQSPLLAFIFPIIVTVLFFGFRAGIFSTILAASIGIYFFLPAHRSFKIQYREDYVQIAVFLAEGLLISVLGYVLRSKETRLHQTLASLSESVGRQNTADQKVRKLEEDLAKVWRLNTLGEMASGLAHELSQPISAIKNYSVAVEKLLGKDTDPLTIASVKGISTEAERASEFIYSLRSFIGSRNPDKRLEAINDVISDVVLLIKSDLNANNIKMQLSLAEPSLKVPLDKIQLIQVVLNLFRNSIESMSVNSSEKKEIFVGTTLQNEGLLLCVSDTGSGIPSADTNRVYDPFFSTKKSGLGMGLAISRSIIEIHEGKIWNVPNEPRGTTFMIWLPNKAGFQ